jgi:hypothetical protein
VLHEANDAIATSEYKAELRVRVKVKALYDFIRILQLYHRMA